MPPPTPVDQPLTLPAPSQGTLVPVDPKAMFLSTLQLVLVPVLVGAAVNQWFPKSVARLRIYTPFVATLIVVLIVGSMISTNVAVVAQSGTSYLASVTASLVDTCVFGRALAVRRMTCAGPAFVACEEQQAGFAFDLNTGWLRHLAVVQWSLFPQHSVPVTPLSRPRRSSCHYLSPIPSLPRVPDHQCSVLPAQLRLCPGVLHLQGIGPQRADLQDQLHRGGWRKLRGWELRSGPGDFEWRIAWVEGGGGL